MTCQLRVTTIPGAMSAERDDPRSDCASSSLNADTHLREGIGIRVGFGWLLKRLSSGREWRRKQGLVNGGGPDDFGA